MSDKSKNDKYIHLENEARLSAARTIRPIEKAKYMLLANHYASKANLKL